MIVRNEQELLAQCLESVRSIVSEIVIVDTGSTDSTIEIARGHGANVFEQEWRDDFSSPRNFSLEKARSDWVIVLDADEAIACEDLEKIQLLTLDSSRCYLMTQRHYTNDQRISAFRPCSGEYLRWEQHHAGYFESALCRLFPRHEGIRFQGRVHELVEQSIGKLPQFTLTHCAVPIHHYGHIDTVAKKKNKGRIYTPLGARKLTDQPANWKAHFELGVEHNSNQRQRESAEEFKTSLQLNPRYVPTWVNLGYVLCELREYAEAEHSLASALKLDPNSHEALCNLGVVYMRTSRLRAAEICFRSAIQKNPLYVNAYCNLGKTLALLRRPCEAANVLYRTLEILPRCTTAKLDLAALYLSAQRPDLAEKFLSSAAEEAPEDPQLSLLRKEFYRLKNP